jgi:hypothetical protein
MIVGSARMKRDARAERLRIGDQFVAEMLERGKLLYAA